MKQLTFGHLRGSQGSSYRIAQVEASDVLNTPRGLSQDKRQEYIRAAYLIHCADSIRGNPEKARELMIDYNFGKDVTLKGCDVPISQLSNERIMEIFTRTLRNRREFLRCEFGTKTQ